LRVFGPFPDISGHIEEPIFVRAEVADGTWRWVERLLAARVPVVDGKPALTVIAGVEVLRQGIILEPAGCRIGPLLVRRQAEPLSCLA
jgi:hypothetical protein